jgi:hypothetical protein
VRTGHRRGPSGTPGRAYVLETCYKGSAHSYAGTEVGTRLKSDMIYGHFGIASNTLSRQLGLQVDYNKSCSDLYADIAQYFIKRDGD